MTADLIVNAAEVAAAAAAVSYCSVAVAVAVDAAAATELILTARKMKYLRTRKIIKLM